MIDPYANKFNVLKGQPKCRARGDLLRLLNDEEVARNLVELKTRPFPGQDAVPSAEELVLWLAMEHGYNIDQEDLGRFYVIRQRDHLYKQIEERWIQEVVGIGQVFQSVGDDQVAVTCLRKAASIALQLSDAGIPEVQVEAAKMLISVADMYQKLDVLRFKKEDQVGKFLHVVMNELGLPRNPEQAKQKLSAWVDERIAGKQIKT